MVYENPLSPYHEQLLSPNSPVYHFVTVDQHGNPIQKFTNQYQPTHQIQQGYVVKGQHRYAPYSNDQRNVVNNNRMVSPVSTNYNTIQHHPHNVTYQQPNYCPSRTPPVMYSPSGVSERSCSVPLSSPYLINENPQSPIFNMENIGTVRSTMPLRPQSQMSVSSVTSPHHTPANFAVGNEHNYVNENEVNQIFSQPNQMMHQSQYQHNFHSENDIKLMIVRKIAEQLETSVKTLDPNPIVVPRIIIRSSSLDSNDSMPDLESISEQYFLEDIMEVIERDIQETRQMFPHRNISSTVHHIPTSTNHQSQVVRIIQNSTQEKIIDFEKIPVKAGRKTQNTVKKFQCVVCKKQFAGGSHLRNHFKTAVHRNEVLNTNQPDPINLPDTWRIDDHICSICAQTFNRRECLLKHMASHNTDGQAISIQI